MKPTALRMIFAAAAMVVAAATASAQTLKAEIPFRFHVGSSWLDAGTYTVSSVRGLNAIPVLRLSSAQSAVLLVPNSPNAPAATDSPAALTFLCMDGKCELARMNDGSREYAFPSSKPSAGTLMSSVPLRVERGE